MNITNMNYTQINSTMACQQLSDIANACAVVCHSMSEACLNNTEISFGNSLSACENYLDRCINQCHTIHEFCLTSNFPVNNKFDNRAAVMSGLILDGLIGMLCIFVLLLVLSKELNEDPSSRPMPALIGATLGMLAGVFGSIAIRGALLPKLEYFPQNNPADMQSADYIASLLGILLTTACAIIGIIAMPRLDKKVNSYILHAYEEGLCNRKRSITPAEQPTEPTHGLQMQLA